ncbi:MAG: hypothetical protein WA057_01725 [Candidatus Magasanikiibacteriota bacterium]
MKKKIIILLLIILVCSLGTWGLVKASFLYKTVSIEKVQGDIIDKAIDSHKVAEIAVEENVVDPFDEDGVVKILLIGLDSRAGQTQGHCDVIQFVSIDKVKQSVVITAVPRGTYSPLPPGKGVTSSDYYVSNACGLGGLEYGIQQIEKILGEKADYLVVVGFSETLGILRNLNLPTVNTLQWLRQRHVYAIGEPQRAHNHSAFLKYLLLNFVPKENSKIDKVLQYITYKTVKTDLSFAEAQALLEFLSLMDLSNNPDKIQLTMRPAYIVQDIQYIPDNLKDYLDATSGTLRTILSSSTYSDFSLTETQAKLLNIIENKKTDPNFIAWAVENNLWLQIEDKEKRFSTQFYFLENYIPFVSSTEERNNLISDYVLEMENRGESVWTKKGRELLVKEI